VLDAKTVLEAGKASAFLHLKKATIGFLSILSAILSETKDLVE
jgi:hypothetical protein